MRDRYVLGRGKARAMPKMFPRRHSAADRAAHTYFCRRFRRCDLSAVARHRHGRVRRLHTIRAIIVATAPGWGRIVGDGQFVYHPSMVAEPPVEIGAAGIAAAIGEPARARMLYCLLDGHARTSTELAIIGEVSPPRPACIWRASRSSGSYRCCARESIATTACRAKTSPGLSRP